MKHEHGELDERYERPSIPVLITDQEDPFNTRKYAPQNALGPDTSVPALIEQGLRAGAEPGPSSASPKLSDSRDETIHLKRKIQSMTEMFRRMEMEKRETMEELENLRRDLALSKRKEERSKSLAVVLLDFELDMFDSTLFHRPDKAGRHAARALRDKVQSYLPGDRGGCSVMAIVFLSRDSQLVADLCAEGVIGSEQELDEFVTSFNKAHPLFLLVSSDAPRDETLQRLRGLAALYSRLDSCSALILGRWALDLECANMICTAPSTAEGSPIYPNKISFVEPIVGTWVPPELIQRSPVILDMSGLLRKSLLRQGGAVKRLELDEYRSLLDQVPPICLQHYFGEVPCAYENCAFSHAYNIPKNKLDTLRRSLLSTPCAQSLQRAECPLADTCLFAHVCPRGWNCSRQGCTFPSFMHPYLSTVDVPIAPNSTPPSKATNDPNARPSGEETSRPRYVKRVELPLTRKSLVVKLKESKHKVQSQALTSIMPPLSTKRYTALPDSGATEPLDVQVPPKSSKPPVIQLSPPKTIDRIKTGDKTTNAAIQRLGTKTPSKEGHYGSKSGRAKGPKWWQVR